MPVDVKDLFNNKLKSAVESAPDAAKKIGGTYQLNIAGAGSWAIDLAAEKPSVTEGTHASPAATIEIADNDVAQLSIERAADAAEAGASSMTMAAMCRPSRYARSRVVASDLRLARWWWPPGRSKPPACCSPHAMCCPRASATTPISSAAGFTITSR
jgi:hypothetical protein